MQYLEEQPNGVRLPIAGGEWAYRSMIASGEYYHVIRLGVVEIIRKHATMDKRKWN